MKKSVTIILSLILIGLSPLLCQAESFKLTFSQSDFSVTRSGDTVSVSTTRGNYIFTSNPEGPSLPIASYSILNPFGQQAQSVETKVIKTLVASSVVMCANGEPVAGTDLHMFPTDKIAASESELQAVSIDEANGIQNGYGFSHYRVMPFLYDAERQELYFVREVTFTPTFSSISITMPSRGDDGMPAVLRPELVDFSEALSTNALNTYSAALNSSALSRANAEQIDFAIITADSLRSAFDELVRWKRMKGIRTKVFSIEEIYAADNTTTDKPLKIKRFLYNLYANNQLEYALLGGDDIVIPARYCSTNVEFIDEIPRTPASDLYYCCFDKTFDWDKNQDGVYGTADDNVDLFPEIAIGRFPFHEKKDILALSRKIVKYESTEQDHNYLNSILIGGCYLINSGSDNEYVAATWGEPTSASRIGHSTYESYLSPYFKGDCNFLFDRNPTENNAFKIDDLESFIYQGSHFLHIITHGSYDSWTTFEPHKPYTSNKANNLNNKNYPIILSSACLVNKYTGTNFSCLSQSFLKNANGGAIAFLGGTDVTIGQRQMFESPAYAHYLLACFYLNLFNESVANYSSQIGKVYNKTMAKIASISSDDRYRYTAYVMNLMADPTMSIYSSLPKKLNYIMKRSGNSFIFNFDELPANTTICVTTLDGMTIKSVQSITRKTHICNTSEPINIVIYSPNHYPETITPVIFKSLVIKDCTIDSSKVYEAEEIVVGENVTVKSGAKLELHYTDKLTVKNAVKCEKGSELIIKHKN